MKKILSIALCLLLVLNIGFASGCKKDIFEGDYKVASEKEVIKVINYFQNNEENLIDWTSGLSIYMYNKTDKIETTLDCKITSSILDGANGVGEWLIEVKNGERTENTKLVYDGLYLYKDIEFAGNTQKIKGKVSFNDVVNFTDIEDFDDLIGEALYLSTEEENVVFYLDKSNKDLTKLKIEEFVDEDGFGFVKVVAYFVFSNNYDLQGVKIEMQVENETSSEKLEMSIEKWSGEISAPSDTDEYNEVDNILK